MMLFLVKFLMPDIANAVQELSKANKNKSNYVHYTQMLREVKYVLQIYSGNKQREMELKCMCDSDYRGDKDNRLSVTGHCIYVNRCLISWKSRAQRSHTLSSTVLSIIRNMYGNFICTNDHGIFGTTISISNKDVL